MSTHHLTILFGGKGGCALLLYNPLPPHAVCNELQAQPSLIGQSGREWRQSLYWKSA